MNWERRIGQASAFEQGQNDPANRLGLINELLIRKREQKEKILQKFGVEQALTDVRTDVWGEGEITQTLDGLTLTSDPFSLVARNFDRPRVSLMRRNIIPIMARGDVSVTVRVNLESSGGPTILIKDLGWPRIDMSGNILQGKTVEDYIKELGWKRGLNRFFLFLESTIRSGLQDEQGEKRIYADIDSVEAFNRDLVTVIETRRRDMALPSQLREEWQKIIDQFPPALREKRAVSVDDLRAWERELKMQRV